MCLCTSVMNVNAFIFECTFDHVSIFWAFFPGPAVILHGSSVEKNMIASTNTSLNINTLSCNVAKIKNPL